MIDASCNNGKRRLSRGGQAIALEIEDDDILNAEFAPIPKGNSGGRRRSSFGGGMLGSKSPVKSAVDQSRIADMYKVIIKMSSENKITAKNSWDLDLIDHMGQIIKEEVSERGQRGVNFQKASCTLDASVKIYAHRVDDTWTSSYRILENLSRNGTGDDENPEDKGPARVGSKAISSRNGLTSTLESNKEALNAKVDSDYNADPMFHKMSQAFDEGGAKGMLMNNLVSNITKAYLVFASI
jgi:condensin complex subunit 2